METKKKKHKERTRICCPKCKGFLFEVAPYLSPLQEVRAFCRKCKSEVKINS